MAHTINKAWAFALCIFLLGCVENKLDQESRIALIGYEIVDEVSTKLANDSAPPDIEGLVSRSVAKRAGRLDAAQVTATLYFSNKPDRWREARERIRTDEWIFGVRIKGENRIRLFEADKDIRRTKIGGWLANESDYISFNIPQDRRQQ